MLKHEVAKKRLEEWTIENRHKTLEPQIAKLPAKLRHIVFAFQDRDRNGKPFDHQSWEKAGEFLTEQGNILVALSPRERGRILKQFFGGMANSVEQGWQFLATTPYQSSWQAQPFRIKNDIATHQRVTWLRNLLQLSNSVKADALSPESLAVWAPFLDNFYCFESAAGLLLAAVIDSGGETGKSVFEIYCQCVRNEHEIGGMSRMATRALMMASQEAGWELMEKTLLAAQRQEGLRQIIFETVVEAHPDAFRRMLKLILDEKLARFSATIRAVGSWFGSDFDSASAPQVNDLLGRTVTFLDQPTAAKKALNGSDSQNVYLAFWAMATQDAGSVIAPARKLLRHADDSVRFATVDILCALETSAARTTLSTAIEDDDLRVAYRAAEGACDGLREPGNKLQLFEPLCQLFERMPARNSESEPLVWPWSKRTLNRTYVAHYMLESLEKRTPTLLLPYTKEFDPWLRSQLVNKLAAVKKWDATVRSAMLDFAGSTAPDVRTAALAALSKTKLTSDEIVLLESYLRRKSSDLRTSVITILLKQKDAAALASADRLLAAKEKNHRAAGLETLRQLAEADRERSACVERAVNWKTTRKQFSKNEQSQLEAIIRSSRKADTLDDCLGLMEPADLTPVVSPEAHKVKCVTPATIALIKGIDDLIHKHRKTVISYRDWRDEICEQPLGSLNRFSCPDLSKPLKPQLDKMPLHDVFTKWFRDRPKSTKDADGFEAVRASVFREFADSWSREQVTDWTSRSAARKPIATLLLGTAKRTKIRYSESVECMIRWLLALHPAKGTSNFILNVIETIYSIVPETDLRKLVERPNQSEDDSDSEDDWRDESFANEWQHLLPSIHDNVLNQRQLKRYWQIQHWLDQPVSGAPRHRPDIYEVTLPYQAGFASLADVQDQILGTRTKLRWGGTGFDELQYFTEPRLEPEFREILTRSPEIGQFIDQARDRILDIELARGEAATIVTPAALSLASIYGVANLIRILTELAKDGFKVDNSYREDRKHTRPVTLTHLASVCYPATHKSPADFSKQIKASLKSGAFPKERLLELAFLAPQWSSHIEHCLTWDGFSEGVYWFLAHMNWVSGATERAVFGTEYQPTETTRDDERDESDGDDSIDPVEKLSPWERLVQHRTPLPAEQRIAGAIDVAWFQTVFQQLKSRKWEALSKAARFAANRQSELSL